MKKTHALAKNSVLQTSSMNKPNITLLFVCLAYYINFLLTLLFRTQSEFWIFTISTIFWCAALCQPKTFKLHCISHGMGVVFTKWRVMNWTHMLPTYIHHYKHMIDCKQRIIYAPYGFFCHFLITLICHLSS